MGGGREQEKHTITSQSMKRQRSSDDDDAADKDAQPAGKKIRTEARPCDVLVPDNWNCIAALLAPRTRLALKLVCKASVARDAGFRIPLPHDLSRLLGMRPWDFDSGTHFIEARTVRRAVEAFQRQELHLLPDVAMRSVTVENAQLVLHVTRHLALVYFADDYAANPDAIRHAWGFRSWYYHFRHIVHGRELVQIRAEVKKKSSVSAAISHTFAHTALSWRPHVDVMPRAHALVETLDKTYICSTGALLRYIDLCHWRKEAVPTLTQATWREEPEVFYVRLLDVVKQHEAEHTCGECSEFDVAARTATFLNAGTHYLEASKCVVACFEETKAGWEQRRRDHDLDLARDLEFLALKRRGIFCESCRYERVAMGPAAATAHLGHVRCTHGQEVAGGQKLSPPVGLDVHFG